VLKTTLAVAMLVGVIALPLVPVAGATFPCPAAGGYVAGVKLPTIDCPVQCPISPAVGTNFCNPPPPPCTGNEDPTHGDSSPLCPPRGAAACLADGIVVTETDILTNNVLVPLSQSQAYVTDLKGFVQPSPSPPNPMANPQAHADAQQAGASYSNTLLGVTATAKTIYSRCDVAAGFDPRGLPIEDAYGRAGVQHLDLSVAGISIRAEVLDYEEEARMYGTPTPMGWAACDIVELVISSPPTDIYVCATPNSALSIPIPLVGTVTLVLNEEAAPVYNFATGQCVDAGAALHVSVATIAATVNVYVGYVAVGVAAPGCPPPPPFGPVQPFFVNPH